MTTDAPAAAVLSTAIRSKDRALVRIAAGLAALSVACCVTVVLLHAWVTGLAELYPLFVADPLLGSVWPVVGALVVRSRPRNPIGWIMMITSFIGPYLLLANYAVTSTLIVRTPLPGADFAAWVGSWGFLPYFFTLPLVSFFFPDGRLASRRWLPVVALVVGLAATTTVIAMLVAPTVDGVPLVPNPYALPAGQPWYPTVLMFGTGASGAIGITLGVLNVVLRMRRSTGVERAQLQWLLLGSLMPLVSIALLPLGSHFDEFSLILAVLGPPVGIAIAMSRHKLFDVELVLNRTIVYAVLSAVVVAGYVGIVFGRLRADLHDGVGPALAGIAHQLDALGRRIETAGDPELAARTQDLGDRLRSTVAQVRSVVHGLRPPILDQVGLAGALRQLVAGYETPRCSATVDELGDMPAGIEVATYALAAEAVANAVRHRGASRINLSAHVHDGSLVVEVRDNGCGIPARPAAGVGLRSMSERAR